MTVLANLLVNFPSPYCIVGVIVFCLVFFEVNSEYDTRNLELDFLTERIPYWWNFWVFIFINILLAIVLYVVITLNNSPLTPHIPDWFKNFDPSIQALIIGVVYQSLIHFKLFSFTKGKTEIPIGFEYFYIKVKEFFAVSINDSIRLGRYKAVEKYLGQYHQRNIADLKREADSRNNDNTLVDSDKQRAISKWIQETCRNDNNLPNEDVKRKLIRYILFDKTD